MAVCTFDNPATFRRECYNEQKIFCSYAAEILPPFAKAKANIPYEHFFFGANVGEWNEGKLWGDVEALPEKYRQFVKESK